LGWGRAPSDASAFFSDHSASGDIVGPFAQRRQGQAQHGQPVEQVGTEAAFAHALFEVASGWR
jgi:hypothetical protein